jgi:hypothetical protein
MKKPDVLVILLSIPLTLKGGTTGPSDDEIFLLIIPVVLLLLYLSFSFAIKKFKEMLQNWKEMLHLLDHENGFS